jgi:hypothetical protein
MAFPIERRIHGIFPEAAEGTVVHIGLPQRKRWPLVLLIILLATTLLTPCHAQICQRDPTRSLFQEQQLEKELKQLSNNKDPKFFCLNRFPLNMADLVPAARVERLILNNGVLCLPSFAKQLLKLYLDEGDLTSAVRLFQENSPLPQDQVDGLEVLTNDCLVRGEPEKAVLILDETKVHPDDKDPFYTTVAHYYADRGEIEAVIQVAERISFLYDRGFVLQEAVAKVLCHGKIEGAQKLADAIPYSLRYGPYCDCPCRPVLGSEQAAKQYANLRIAAYRKGDYQIALEPILLA